MYMYGPSIIASTDFSYSTKSYPSNVVICAAQGGLSEDTYCFKNQTDYSMDGKQMVWLVEGTITALYSFNRTETFNNTAQFTGASDLLKETLDLHVFNDYNGSSFGTLLINEGLGYNLASEELCLVSFQMFNGTILFTQLLPSQQQFCSNNKGFNLQYLYVYNYRNASGGGHEYLSGKINNEIILEEISVDMNEYVGTFIVKPYGQYNNITTVHINDIQNITFSLEQPPTPTAI